MREEAGEAGNRIQTVVSTTQILEDDFSMSYQLYSREDIGTNPTLH